MSSTASVVFKKASTTGSALPGAEANTKPMNGKTCHRTGRSIIILLIGKQSSGGL